MAHYYLSPHGDDANPGTLEQPWRTPHRAAANLQPGDTAYFRAGVYLLNKRIEPASGAPGQPITFAAYPGEQAVIDGAALDNADFHQRPRPYHAETGLFHLVNVSHIVIRDLTIINSYWAGINIHDSQSIDILNNHIERTFGSAVAIWDMSRQGVCHHHRVLGNTVVKANTWDMRPIHGYEPLNEPPHEAISIAGANHFEVAYNHVHHCEKEGIDVKETSKHGVVHHNYVHHVDRQGLYADTWFGVLEDVEFHHNVVHDFGGAGIAISVEDQEVLRDLRIHHNLVYNGLGSCLFFSRWGQDRLRHDIRIYNNTFHHGGYGTPDSAQDYFYLVGGMFLYSTQVEDLEVRDNIFSASYAFEFGASTDYLQGEADLDAALARQNIRVTGNLVCDQNHNIPFPIRVYETTVLPFQGNATLRADDPGFADPENGDFSLRPDSPAAKAGRQIGVYAPGERPDFWWRHNFPPRIEQ
jgi:hypothetical protein